MENIWDPTGDPIPGYRILSENGYGYSKREQIPYTNPPAVVTGDGDAWLHALYQLPSTYLYGAFFKGYNSVTSYSVSTSTVFSPWSNPPANIWDSPSSSADFSMEILNESTGVITVHFYITHPEDSKPAKPQNFSAVNQTGYPYLSWDANNEPDLAAYKIYKTVSPLVGYPQTFILTIPSSTTSYTDEFFHIGGRPTDMVSYYLKAYDIQGKNSDKTDSISFNGQSYIQWKQLAETNIPKQYLFEQNYPNPFNPKTTIKYGLSEPSDVIITVFDFIGREVITLVTGFETGGYNQVTWNGTNNDGIPVASGMYICIITATSNKSNKEFIQSQKMVLLR